MPVAWSVKEKQYSVDLAVQKKLLWHELTTLGIKVPASELESSQMLWLALSHFVDLPKTYHDEEVNHRFGTVSALAAGINKSVVWGQPLLELHATVCPSYLDKPDWEAAKPSGPFVYQKIKLEKLAVLQDFAARMESFGKYIRGIFLHTPAPEDLQLQDLSACFGIFNQGEAGKASLEIHWQQMQTIVAQLPGVSLMPDVSYIMQFMKPGFFEKFMSIPFGQKVLTSFQRSTYINMAYRQWGIPAEAVLKVFYLGSIFAYGNHKIAFRPTNQFPVKLYLNLEENQSPYTFSGQSVGVDFRHLLQHYRNYHLPLLIGKSAIVSPWAGQ